MFDFNSIKVRLELRDSTRTPKRRCNFNSIKVRLERLRGYWYWGQRQQFQFHKGAIRTEQKMSIFCALIYFNSIKVRLELWYLRSRAGYYRFQFHKGAIRTCMEGRVFDELRDFNSIKVRLEPLTYNVEDASTAFQFHKGAIRTVCFSFPLKENNISIP